MCLAISVKTRADEGRKELRSGRVQFGAVVPRTVSTFSASRLAVMMVPVARSTVAAGKAAIRPDRHCPPTSSTG